jgi:hypothetical protein
MGQDVSCPYKDMIRVKCYCLVKYMLFDSFLDLF